MSKDPDSYGWILLRPGGGHIEINMFREFFEIYFDVFLEDLAKLLGFQSEKAISYCKKATDHHKTWDIIRIALEGTSAEMVLPYGRMCLLVQAIYDKYVPNLEQIATKMK